MECTDNTGFPGFGLCVQGDNPDLRDRRRLLEERMQLAESKDGGSVYTESDREVQNGNSGSNDTAKGRQENRRVELVISGDVIGAEIGTPIAAR